MFNIQEYYMSTSLDHTFPETLGDASKALDCQLYYNNVRVLGYNLTEGRDYTPEIGWKWIILYFFLS